jgi:hypothetical protein
MNIALRNGMPTVERALGVPAAAVWDVLIDLGAWPQWGPTVQRADLDDSGPLTLGSRGRVWTPIGIALPFEITEFEPGRRWAWRVAGVPATTHGVDPDDDGCRLWMSAPVWAPPYLAVLAIALRRIQQMVSA